MQPKEIKIVYHSIEQTGYVILLFKSDKIFLEDKSNRILTKKILKISIPEKYNKPFDKMYNALSIKECDVYIDGKYTYFGRFGYDGKTINILIQDEDILPHYPVDEKKVMNFCL